MANVTYLLGAGASANTIPTVINIIHRFAEIIEFLKDRTRERLNEEAFKLLPPLLQEHNKLIFEIIEDILWLKTEASKHQTIDTLAKKYYLTGSKDLLRLKKTLIIYFSIEQLLFIDSHPQGDYTFNKAPELRYDSFFASILAKDADNRLSVNPNVKILTWNYDQQIELALKTYVSKNINLVKELYQILPHEKTISSFDKFPFDNDLFGAVKINGNAILSNPTITGEKFKTTVYDKYNTDLYNSTLLGYILQEYDIVTNSNNGKNLEDSLLYFNFSWESDESFTNKYLSYYEHRKSVIKIAKKTNVLVIIGYSFPIFNRDTDKDIIDNMTSLNKIYIQDPNCESIQSILLNGFTIFEERMFEDVKVEIQLEKSTNQFLIPFEL